MDPTLFQYCQKIVLFRNNNTEVLLARRVGEADYNATYSFIGGKMEITDRDILSGLEREKVEEIGSNVKVKICPYFSYNAHFVKASGQHMILPHYYAEYIEGEVVLNEEYDQFQWVPLSELRAFEPKVENIPVVVGEVLHLAKVIKEDQFVVI